MQLDKKSPRSKASNKDKASRDPIQSEPLQRTVKKGLSPKVQKNTKPGAIVARPKKQLTLSNSKAVQNGNIYEDLKTSLDAHLTKAFEAILRPSKLGPAALEDKYSPETIALLLDQLFLSLHFHDPKAKVQPSSALESIVKQVLKDFIKEQDTIFKRHFPHFESLLRHATGRQNTECVSIKDLIQVVNTSQDTPESPYKKSLGLILSTDLSASLTLIAVEKLKKSKSAAAIELLSQQLGTLKDKLNEGLESLQAIEAKAESLLKNSQATKTSCKLALSPEATHAFKEELLRSKRFILSLEDTLSALKSDSHSPTKRLELWAQQDIKAFLEVLDDKIKIAHCIGDTHLESKLSQLKNKFYLYSNYPHTLKLGLKDAETVKLDPDSLKLLLHKQFIQSLQTIGYQDPHLAHKVDQKYLKQAGSLELGFKKIFWVPYPQLKVAVGEFLDKFKETETIFGAIDQLPTGALRNKKSYIREAQDLLKELKQLEPKLDQSLKHAQDKARTKAIPLDPTIEDFVKGLKASLPTTEQLKASGYWTE